MKVIFSIARGDEETFVTIRNWLGALGAIVGISIAAHWIETPGTSASIRQAKKSDLFAPSAASAAETPKQSQLAAATDRTAERDPIARLAQVSDESEAPPNVGGSDSERERFPYLSLPVLSGAWARSFMDDCEVLQGCGPWRKVVIKIASDEKNEADSWPYRLEYELQEFLSAASRSNNFATADIKCSGYGCLIFVTGNQRNIFGRGLQKGVELFAYELESQSWMNEFQPLAELLNIPTTRREWWMVDMSSRCGVLFVMTRRKK